MKLHRHPEDFYLSELFNYPSYPMLRESSSQLAAASVKRDSTFSYYNFEEAVASAR